MALVLGALTFAPTLAFAADATFFGPIIPEECHCPGSAPDWGCVMQVMQNGINFVVSISIIAFTLMIAYAGAMYMASAANPKQHSDAVKMAQNVVLGLLVLLSAWLLVDFVMKVLYDGRGSGFGPWQAILADGEARMCLEVNQNQPQAPTTPNGTGTTTEDQQGSDNNCGVDPDSMVEVPASATLGATERATSDTIERFMRMRAAAAQADIDLKVVDGYRSDAEQLTLWNQNGCTDGSCARPTAKPCSLGGNGSNHVTGEALDLNVGCTNGQTNCNTRSYNWLKQNGAQYGFRNSLPSDPVHWSPTGR